MRQLHSYLPRPPLPPPPQINTLDGIHNAKAATLQVSGGAAAGAAALGDDAGLADAALGVAA